jgi:hypothetical protein
MMPRCSGIARLQDDVYHLLFGGHQRAMTVCVLLNLVASAAPKHAQLACKRLVTGETLADAVIRKDFGLDSWGRHSMVRKTRHGQKWAAPAVVVRRHEAFAWLGLLRGIHETVIELATIVNPLVLLLEVGVCCPANFWPGHSDLLAPKTRVVGRFLDIFFRFSARQIPLSSYFIMYGPKKP